MLPWTRAFSFVAFSVLIIQTPILVLMRLSGILSVTTCPDWVFAVLIVGVLFNIYALKTKLFFD